MNFYSLFTIIFSDNLLRFRTQLCALMLEIGGKGINNFFKHHKDNP